MNLPNRGFLRGKLKDFLIADDYSAPAEVVPFFIIPQCLYTSKNGISTISSNSTMMQQKWYFYTLSLHKNSRLYTGIRLNWGEVKKEHIAAIKQALTLLDDTTKAEMEAAQKKFKVHVVPELSIAHLPSKYFYPWLVCIYIHFSQFFYIL